MSHSTTAGGIAARIMQELFGEDIYQDFTPELPRDLQGWNSQHPVFGRIIAELEPAICLDVGVWKGASSVHIAGLAARRLDDWVVIGVDRFLGSFDPRYGVPRRRGRCLLYEQYMANAHHEGFAGKIIPVAESSVAAADMLARRGIVADFIHIDASHDYADVLADLRAYWRMLRPGGVMIGDDYAPSWPGVVRAADEFAAEVGVPLAVEQPKFVLRKPSGSGLR